MPTLLTVLSIHRLLFHGSSAGPTAADDPMSVSPCSLFVVLHAQAVPFFLSALPTGYLLVLLPVPKLFSFPFVAAWL